jgi:hypothetical protein
MNNYLYKGKIFTFTNELGEGYKVSTNEADQNTHYVLVSDERAEEIRNPQVKKREPALEEVRYHKLVELDYHDKSDMVNSFIFRGNTTWLDRDTRTSLRITAQNMREEGYYYMTYWVNGSPHEITCENMLNLLRSVELYAYECYRVTSVHRSNINACNTIEELEGYDYRIGYPDKVII